MPAGSDLAAACDHTIGCITCGDEAVPLRVAQVDHESGLARCVGPDGSSEAVEVALVTPVSAGDRLLVHAGTALLTLEEAAA